MFYGMIEGNEKKFILTKCLFKKCWSVGVGGGVGDIFLCDFILSDCEFINCSEGNHKETSLICGGSLAFYLFLFIIILFLFALLFHLNLQTLYELESCVFSDTLSDRYGGAIILWMSLSIIHCHFDQCKIKSNPDSQGGAIYTNKDMNITSCVFSGCVSYESTWELPSGGTSEKKNFVVVGSGKNFTILTIGPQNYNRFIVVILI
jgi:hypothetical protein